MDYDDAADGFLEKLQDPAKSASKQTPVLYDLWNNEAKDLENTLVFQPCDDFCLRTSAFGGITHTTRELDVVDIVCINSLIF